MKKIVSVIKPFIINQNVFVYEDGNKIDAIQVPLNELQNMLIKIANQYEAYDVELIGSKKYINGIVNKVKENEIAQYNENKIKITIANG